MQDSIFEISIFGGGNGYGESILVKIDKEWIIIDSFINPSSSLPTPIEYLKEIGVDLSKDVKKIICTHWHDDHFRGIADIFEQCHSADFFCSDCIDTQEFTNLYGITDLDPVTSPTKEISKIIDILKSRNKVFHSLRADQLLHQQNVKSNAIKIWALSPSQKSINASRMQLSKVLTQYSDDKVLPPSPSPNEASVALLFEINNFCFILGSDLPYFNDSDKGWKHVIENSQICQNKKAVFFKVPHHGSSTSYHPTIWAKLLEDNPIVGLTSYSKGWGVPNQKDINNILQHTDNAYITSSRSDKKRIKKRDKTVTNMLSELRIDITEIPFEFGQIKLSTNNLSNPIFSLELIKSAIHLNKYF